MFHGVQHLLVHHTIDIGQTTLLKMESETGLKDIFT